MILTPIAFYALRVAVLLALALGAMPLLRRASSATRRLVLALALGGALVLPAIAAIAPAWRVETPISIPLIEGTLVAESLESAPPTTVPTPDDARQPTPHPSVSSSLFSWSLILGVIWAAGALVVLGRLLVGLVRARAIVRRAEDAPMWGVAIAKAELATGLCADVRATDELDVPAVTGVITPIVLVPRSSEAWSDERRTLVLLHELAHVRQADCFTQIIGHLVCAVHWFDPLAWLVLRRLVAERELAADDAVIAAGGRASTYAEDLLAIAGVGARRTPGVLGMADRSAIGSRIEAIVSAARARHPPSHTRRALLVLISTLTLLAIACASPASHAPEIAGSASANGESASGTSTLDPKLQAFADEELERAVAEWHAAAGAIVVLDPTTGEILVNAGRAHGAPADVGIQSAYLTGSTMKAVTLAAALEEGVISPADQFDCENGSWTFDGKTMTDAHPNGSLTVPEMLAVSSNIGFAKIFNRLGGAPFERWLKAFHFGAAPAIAGATAGAIPDHITDKTYRGAVVAIGEGWVTASPLQIAAAYAAFANDGAYVAPTLTRRTAPAPREQIMKPATARAVVAMLEGVVTSDHGTGAKARVAGVRVAGKTGTAGWLPSGVEIPYASFVGLVPVEHPRFVIIAALEGSGGDELTGGAAAAPLFAKIASRALLP